MVWRVDILPKLKNKGINGRMFNYINNFLTDTRIKVKIDDSYSDIFTLENGVNQGSVISPVLFLVAIHDILENVKNVPGLLFADDVGLYKIQNKINQTINSMQAALNAIQTWSDTWGFTISISIYSATTTAMANDD
jgi:hypothetical protein